MNTTVGSKYYKYLEDGQLEMVRLEKIKNQDSYIVREESGTKLTLTRNEILEYTKLNPAGYITFALVALDGNMADVVVTLHRKEDIDKGDNVPYCACRQNIFDLFTNQLERNEKINHIGVSVSKDTCPADVKYEIVLACNGVIKMTIVNIYMDDTLEEILSYVPTVAFDEALKKLSNMMDKDTVQGSCTSVHELLKSNNFMDDFFRAYNIHYMPYIIMNNVLAPVHYIYIESILKHEVLNGMIVKYDYDIDIKSIESNHIIVSDPLGNLYIVAYVKGAYVNREYEALDDKSDRDILVDIKNNNS